MEHSIKSISLTILEIAFAISGILFKGVVLSLLWKWFVVPPTGFMELTFEYAVGFVLIASFFKVIEKHHVTSIQEETADRVFEMKYALVKFFVHPSYVLCFAYLIK